MIKNLCTKICFYALVLNIKFIMHPSTSNAQPQKVPRDILEKNETKAMHRITFRASKLIVLMHKVFHLLL